MAHVALLKVLAVDTDPAALRLLADALRRNGYDVTPAEDFEAAIERLSAADFDALITAHRLGAHNGLHLVLRARLASPHVVSVVVSHVSDPYLAAEATALGSIAVTAPILDPSFALDALRQGVSEV
jgi:DNA-binding response OmpR family regulator